MTFDLAAHTAPAEVSALIWGEQYRAYEGTAPNGLSDTPCAVCGRKCSPTGKSRHVLLNVSGEVMEPTAEVENELEATGHNMGCHPVGSACAKRIPAKYLTELRPLDV